MTFTIVYTLSDRGDMPKQIEKSLKSLSRFVERENIVVFYTPPRNIRTAIRLGKYAIFTYAENVTSPFTFDPVLGSRNYGEKIHLCEISTSSVIFLDCDTIINKDITELLEGDFDFSARLGRNTELNWIKWKTYCKKLNKPMKPLYNAGFLIFKNHLHLKIKKEWSFYLESDIPQLNPRTYNKEEYALALALPTKRVRPMTEKEHACAWLSESGEDSYVLHGYPRTLSRRIRLRLRSLIWR